MKDNQAKYPQLRFKGFTDPWEHRKLGDTETYFTDGNYGESYPSAKDMSDKANGIPFLRGSDFSNGYLDSSNANYIKPEKNAELTSGHIKQDDIVLAVRGSLGTLGYATKENEGWNINSQLAILRTNKSEISGRFLIQYLLGSKGQKEIFSRNTGTALKQLPIKQLKDIPVPVPTLLEQQKIGNFFKELDSTIILHQRKLAKLKELKQGYLQKMFPKKGAKVPELRFAGFADAWEQRKLGEILAERNDQITETNEYPLMSFVQGKGVTPKGKRYNRSFLVKNIDKKYKKTELGDFIYSSNNLETGSIGLNRTGKAVISPVYSIFKSKRKQESQFIGIMSARKDFIFKMIRFRQGVVYGQWRIHESDFLNIDIRIPSYEEQQSIICFFEKLNKAITLHQRKLEKLQELKKGYLQKMFC